MLYRDLNSSLGCSILLAGAAVASGLISIGKPAENVPLPRSARWSWRSRIAPARVLPHARLDPDPVASGAEETTTAGTCRHARVARLACVDAHGAKCQPCHGEINNILGLLDYI